MLAVVLIAAITGLYLNISAQAATSGRKIQYLESDIEDINNEIADLTTQLAKAQSTDNMRAQAEELGFKMINPNNAVYLEIPGYDPNADLVLAPPRVNIIAESPIVKSSYKISLWEWFIDQIWQPTTNSTRLEGEPLP
jgi:hypothetical protein